MYLPIVPELNLLGVADAGVPNKERVMLRPTENVCLAQFGVAIGVSTGREAAQLLREQTFWLPDISIEPPAWVLIYTGSGSDTQEIVNGQPVFVFYWHKPLTVFGDPALVPVLVRINAAKVGPGSV